jgi:hypothetical protein
MRMFKEVSFREVNETKIDWNTILQGVPVTKENIEKVRQALQPENNKPEEDDLFVDRYPGNYEDLSDEELNRPLGK